MTHSRERERASIALPADRQREAWARSRRVMGPLAATLNQPWPCMSRRTRCLPCATGAATAPRDHASAVGDAQMRRKEPMPTYVLPTRLAPEARGSRRFRGVGPAGLGQVAGQISRGHVAGELRRAGALRLLGHLRGARQRRGRQGGRDRPLVRLRDHRDLASHTMGAVQGDRPRGGRLAWLASARTRQPPRRAPTPNGLDRRRPHGSTSFSQETALVSRAPECRLRRPPRQAALRSPMPHVCGSPYARPSHAMAAIPRENLPESPRRSPFPSPRARRPSR